MIYNLWLQTHDQKIRDMINYLEDHEQEEYRNILSDLWQLTCKLSKQEDYLK